MDPSNCECECDKSCDVGEFLDYENCICRKRLVDKLVGEYNKNIDEEKLTEVTLFEHKNECKLHSFYCLGWNCLNNQHWDQCSFCLL